MPVTLIRTNLIQVPPAPLDSLSLSLSIRQIARARAAGRTSRHDRGPGTYRATHTHSFVQLWVLDTRQITVLPHRSKQIFKQAHFFPRKKSGVIALQVVIAIARLGVALRSARGERPRAAGRLCRKEGCFSGGRAHTLVTSGAERECCCWGALFRSAALGST